MIKIKREALERLLLMAMYFERQGFTFKNLIADSWKTLRFPLGWPRQDTLFRQLYNNGVKEGRFTEWSSLHEACKDALVSSEGSTSHHPGLIDVLVDVLESPNARQVLTAKNLDTLRKAFLLPENMVKLGESLRKEMGCANCGHPFMNHEMATCGIEDHNGTGMVFYCAKCSTPHYTACRNCGEGSAELDQEALNKLTNKCRCEICVAPKKTEAPAEQAINLNEPIYLGAGPQDVAAPPVYHVQHPLPPDMQNPWTWREDLQQWIMLQPGNPAPQPAQPGAGEAIQWHHVGQDAAGAAGQNAENMRDRFRARRELDEQVRANPEPQRRNR